MFKERCDESATVPDCVSSAPLADDTLRWDDGTIIV